MEQEKVNEKIIPRKLLLWITIVIAISLLLLSLLSIYFVFIYPENQVSQLGITNVTEKANFINQTRTTFISFFVLFAQILGGGAVAIGIYLGWGNLKVALVTLESNQNKARDELKLAQDALIADQNKARDELKLAQDTLEANMKIAQENLKVAQEGQITERFTRAVDQLGNPAIEIRLGGIYALERISIESEKDYWPIMKILAAYIREKSYVKENTVTEDYEQQEKDKPLSTDIQVILDLIYKREHSFNEKLDLRNSNLRNARLFTAHLEGAELCKAHLEGADLQGAHLEKANLTGAHLEGAHLEGAYLRGANLEGANLEGAHLEGAHLEETHLEYANLKWAHLEEANLFEAHLDGDLEGAHLEGAHLEEAHLEYANLKWAHLEEANLFEAHLEGAYLEYANLKWAHLEYANLEGAHLEEAHLEYASLEGANLEGANLEGANLQGAKNLTVDQLSEVKTLYNAKLDEGLEAEFRAKGFGHLLDDEPERDET